MIFNPKLLYLDTGNNPRKKCFWEIQKVSGIEFKLNFFSPILKILYKAFGEYAILITDIHDVFLFTMEGKYEQKEDIGLE